MSHSDNPKKRQKDYSNEDLLNYEFSPISHDKINLFRPPPVPGGLFPPNLPDTSFPPFPPHTGGGYAPPSGTDGLPGSPETPPPNFIPKKEDNGSQSFGNGSGPSLKSVSNTSIRICLYRYTYIWESNGRGYWTYLIYVDRRSVSGYKWMGRTWVLFGLDLRRIDSFYCYRSDVKQDNSRLSQEKLVNTKKEYSLTGVREIYSIPLTTVCMSESKEDFLVQSIGVFENQNIQSTIPCIKSRDINYRICIEISYPETLDQELKSKINTLTNQLSEDTLIILNRKNSRQSNLSPFESFDNSLSCITTAFESFAKNFSRDLNTLITDNTLSNDITYKIVYEKIPTNWSIIY